MIKIRQGITYTFLAVGSEPEPLGARTLKRSLPVNAQTFTTAVIHGAFVHI